MFEKEHPLAKRTPKQRNHFNSIESLPSSTTQSVLIQDLSTSCIATAT